MIGGAFCPRCLRLKYMIGSELMNSGPEIGELIRANGCPCSLTPPQKDPFVHDISDVVPKDNLASMEHPLFSLATKPDMRHLEYRGRNSRLKIVLSGAGLPAILTRTF